MNYYQANRHFTIKGKVAVLLGATNSSKELAKKFGFNTTVEFTRSKLCKEGFTKFFQKRESKKEKKANFEVDKDGYSKYGRHIPSSYTDNDHEALKKGLFKLLKKFNAREATVVFNVGSKPSSINIKL